MHETARPPETASAADDPADRRRHARQRADRRYLTVAGRPGQLLDWSFGGIGAILDTPADGLAVGDRIVLRILRRDGVTWADLSAFLRRIEADGRTIGTELTEDGDDSVPVLLELLSHRLSGHDGDGNGDG